MKKQQVIFYILLMLPVASLMAAEGDAAVSNNLPQIALYIIGGAGVVIIAAASSTIFQLLFSSLEQQEEDILHESGQVGVAQESHTKEPSPWQKLWSKLTDTVPIEKERTILLDHNYDGIQELDNNLPPWWVYGFYLSIVVAVFYIGYYHYSDNAISSQEEYALDMAQAQKDVRQYLAAQGNKVDETNVELLEDPDDLAAGATLFKVNCVACHLEHGGGAASSVGPNLTDEYWLHGGGIKDLFRTIKYGVVEKGMQSWQKQLRPSDMQKVASYILSLQGTNPPGAKAAQGEKWIPEAEPNQ